MRTALAHDCDSRTVVTDPAARYFGARLQERSLLAHDDAVIAETRFSDWLAVGVIRPPQVLGMSGPWSAHKRDAH